MINTVVIIPTLNEEKNIKILIQKIFKIQKNIDIFFIDDGSTDNTQKIIKNERKKNKKISFKFRKNKSGVGSAHKAALKICYKKNYKYIFTMDADGTHDPKALIKMIRLQKKTKGDLVNTTRFLLKNSISDWPLTRKIMTNTRHILVKFFLGMKYDASGAFRLYVKSNIKLADILKAKDDRYAFFWESLFVLHLKNYKIVEIPIELPYRTNGASKMRIKDIFTSLYYLIKISLRGKSEI